MNRAPLLTPGRRRAAPPVLGDLCVPGCRLDEVDHDGTHHCVAIVGDRVPAIVGPGRPRRHLVLEVTQTQREDGTLERLVWLVAYDKHGRYTGDEVGVEVQHLPALLEVLAAAQPVAEGAA